jgi:hypothetical protein
VQAALGELVNAAKDGLLALSVGVGLGVLSTLMEEEVFEVVGPKGRHDRDRSAVRHGSTGGEVRSVAAASLCRGHGCARSKARRSSFRRMRTSPIASVWRTGVEQYADDFEQRVLVMAAGAAAPEHAARTRPLRLATAAVRLGPRVRRG